MPHGPIPDKPELVDLTVEEATRNWRAAGRALREQEVRNIMAITGCNRVRAERMRVWLRDDELVIGRLHRVERAGLSFGERLAKAFQPLVSVGRRYRS